MMPETLISILMLDGRARMCCVGCTQRLLGLGMVKVVGEAVINQAQPEFVVTTFEIAAPFNLGNCRAAIRDRHVGPEWGE